MIKPTIYPEDQQPPQPWRTFDIRLRAGGQGQVHQTVLRHLSDAELAWVARTVAAELVQRTEDHVAI